MFLGQFKAMQAPASEKEQEPKTAEKPPEERKSSNADDFLKTPETRDFVNRWAAKARANGEPVYTKRGVIALLRALYPGLDTDKKIRESADGVLKMLGGMDGLQGFLMGWKAKSEGIIKGLKSILGGK